MVKIFLDAREMEHPEPLVQAVEHLKTMDEDSYLYMLNHKKPSPLLEIAKNNGFYGFSYEDDARIWHIMIAKRELDFEALLEL